ncbi:winged helix-turn-helix domain-containing protein [Pelagibius marinus]|uniref:winged helix-turn-helix domain-containing protein n=1 Tax=Pelagibius marinus TaxID=2762760 RepID=UPI001872A95B|nr:winged helix-turn-helix domain-containing protein [Pelagibius marinus]
MKSQSGFIDLRGPYRIGSCRVDPATGRIQGGDCDVRLQPQAIKVLTYLAGRPGEVVPRSEIEDAIWQDRVVGYDALTSIIFKLRKALGDDPKEPRIIETLSKRGYRLLAAPQPDTGQIGEEVAEQSDGTPPRRRFGGRPLRATAAAMATAFLAAGLFWLTSRDDQVEAPGPLATRSAVVVLPFQQLGALDGREHLADGLTDDLTTALAKSRNLLVIARDSAFVYKDGTVDYKEVAQRLGVDYILRGTVRGSGEGLRVNVQLVDASNGSHRWAESFDSDAGRIFDVEDRVLRAVVPLLTEEAGSAESERLLVARTSSAAAYRAFQLGRQHFYLYRNKPENAKARKFFEEALTQDPDFAMAHAMLAWTYVFDAVNGWASDRTAALRRADEAARLAIAADPEIPLSYFITGLVFRERGEDVKAMVEVEKALALDPNYANAHVLLATLFYYAGRPAESVERLKQAMRLNPHHPFNYQFHLGQAYFVLRDYDKAIEALLAGVESNPASERLHIWLAASYAQAGRMDDADWEAEQVRILNPDFSLAAITEAFPFKDPVDRDHFVAALRKAGFS